MYTMMVTYPSNKIEKSIVNTLRYGSRASG